MNRKQIAKMATTAPTLIVPDDPMHKALADAQAKMTPEQTLAFLEKLFPPASSAPAKPQVER
jgi:hypothetical protein